LSHCRSSYKNYKECTCDFFHGAKNKQAALNQL